MISIQLEADGRKIMVCGSTEDIFKQMEDLLSSRAVNLRKVSVLKVDSPNVSDERMVLDWVKEKMKKASVKGKSKRPLVSVSSVSGQTYISYTHPWLLDDNRKRKRKLFVRLFEEVNDQKKFTRELEDLIHSLPESVSDLSKDEVSPLLNRYILKPLRQFRPFTVSKSRIGAN